MSGYIGNKSSVVSSGAERKKTFAITATTTSLTGLAYTPNLVHVFHNGIRLVDGTDYTATNGTSITLTNAAENGDEVVVVSYASFQPSDTVSASLGGFFEGNVTVNADLTVTGDVDVADKITHTGDTDTSIRFPAADTVTVETAGSERMRIDSSGNVGIGTSSPIAKLDVAGPVVIRNANAIDELTFSGNEYTNIYSQSTNGFDIGTTSSAGSSFLRFLTENTERLRIDGSGNVLVGTTATTGSVSNFSQLVSGKFVSIQGTQVGLYNTATTVATLPYVSFATYMVSGGLPAGDTTNYHNVAIVCTQASSTKITNLVTSNLFFITMSGLNVQMRQSSGLTQIIYYYITRIA